MPKTVEVEVPVPTTEDVVEAVEAVRTMSLKQAVVLASTVSLLSGVAVGYAVATRQLKTRYEQLANEEIAEAKEFYAQLNKVGDYSDPEELAKKYEEQPEMTDVDAKLTKDAIEALRDYQGKDPAKVLGQDKPEDDEEALAIEAENVNIFVAGGHFNYDEEVAKRTQDEPYVITNVEYFQNEKEYDQSTITYYEGDGVLTDERDDIIEDESIVGEKNLTRFGDGSGDNNIVFVRNENLEMEWEILRSRGKFAKEVLGFDEDDEDSLKHSIRRFRSED